MTFVGVDQDQQVVCEPRIFDIGVLAVACDFPRSLQHFVHLIEVEITEQGRDHSPNAKGNFCFDRVIALDRSRCVLDLRLKGNIHMTDVAIDRCAEGGTSQCGPQLLARGQSVGEAALSLSRQFAMSRRQAYRYIEEAQLIGRPVPVVETATAVTFKLPPSLVDAVRTRAAVEGTTISDMVSRARRSCLGEAGGNG